MTTRIEMMQTSAQSQIAQSAESLTGKLEEFEITHPEKWLNISETLYAYSDLNLGDLLNILERLTEIAQEN